MHIYEYSVASSCVSPHSGKLSTRNAPQPNTDPGALDVAAEFAKFVAKAASELSILPTFLNHAPPPRHKGKVTQREISTYVEIFQVVKNWFRSLYINSITAPDFIHLGIILTLDEFLSVSK